MAKGKDRLVKNNTDLLIRIRDNLFDEREKTLLNMQVGSTHFDIKDQLLTHYGNHYMVYDDMDTFNAFAKLKTEKGDYYLEQLRVLNDRLPYLMQGANFYRTDIKEYKRDQTGNTEGEYKTEVASTYNSYSYDTGDNTNMYRLGNISKSAAALNSEETQGLENQMYDGIKQTNFTRKLKRKRINATLKDNKLVGVSTQEQDPAPDTAIEKFTGTTDKPTLYTQQNITNSINLGEYETSNASESMSLTKGDNSSTSNSTSHRVDHVTGDINSKSYVSSEADMKVLRLELPRLRNKFGGVFGSLFTMNPY